MRARVAVAILLGFLLIAAGVAYFVSSTSTGTLTIQVHDVPVSWSHVVVTFSEVSVHPASAPNGTGWVSLPLQVERIDFLALGNLPQRLALGRVAPGTYSGIGVLISAASGILSSGDPVVMSVSGGTLQVGTPFLVQGGGTTTVTLDLNLSQSISQTNLGWVFAPVLGPTEVG